MMVHRSSGRFDVYKSASQEEIEIQNSLDALTHSLTHALTHALTHSLTLSVACRTMAVVVVNTQHAF